jgi:hypothetical protein
MILAGNIKVTEENAWKQLILTRQGGEELCLSY